eukprot:4943552-Pleurochrysis_carterae.AAC.1
MRVDNTFRQNSASQAIAADFRNRCDLVLSKLDDLQLLKMTPAVFHFCEKKAAAETEQVRSSYGKCPNRHVHARWRTRGAGKRITASNTKQHRLFGSQKRGHSRKQPRAAHAISQSGKLTVEADVVAGKPRHRGSAPSADDERQASRARRGRAVAQEAGAGIG